MFPIHILHGWVTIWRLLQVCSFQNVYILREFTLLTLAALIECALQLLKPVKPVSNIYGSHSKVYMVTEEHATATGYAGMKLERSARLLA